MAQIKEKVKHFLHHDKADKETTPGASPGYADVQTVPTNTTTHVPEAFYPGSRAVIPQETHPTAPYTGALGTYMPGAPTNGAAPRQAPAVPQDSAAMLGVPPAGGHMTSTQPEEATPTTFPSQADRGTGDHSEQTPETREDTSTPTGPEDLDEDLPMVPVSDVEPVEGKPEDESTDKTPEETNLEDNSSYSPMEEHTEAEPPATD